MTDAAMVNGPLRGRRGSVGNWPKLPKHISCIPAEEGSCRMSHWLGYSIYWHNRRDTRMEVVRLPMTPRQVGCHPFDVLSSQLHTMAMVTVLHNRHHHQFLCSVIAD